VAIPTEEDKMLYTVWKVEGQQASEITAPDAKPNAIAAAETLNAHAAEGVRYEALPLGGSPFDGAEDDPRRFDDTSDHYPSTEGV